MAALSIREGRRYGCTPYNRGWEHGWIREGWGLPKERGGGVGSP